MSVRMTIFLSLRNLTSILVSFIQTWFLDSDTAMNPNLNYAQMQRGPDGQIGTHTGVLWVLYACVKQNLFERDFLGI